MKKNKIFLFLGLLVFISFVVSAFVSIESMSTVVDDCQKDLTISVAAQIYNDIGIELSNPIVVSQTMSNNYFLKKYLSDPDFPETKESEQTIIKYLEDMKDDLGYNSVFVVSNLNGKYYTMNGFNKIVDPIHDEHDIWYKLFVESGLKYDFDVDVDEVHDNAWSVFVNCRVVDDNGDLIGVCGVGMDMTYLQGILNSYEEEYDIRVNFVDENGLVQIDTDTINIENAVLNEAVAHFDKRKDYSYAKTEEGGYVVSKYVDSFGWYLVVSSDTNNSAMYWRMYLKLALSLAFIFGLMILGDSYVVKWDRKELELRSTIDGMTGLLNKKTFMELASEQTKIRSNVPYAFIFIDLDKFKLINDKLGHSEGDKAIKDIAEIIKEVFGTDELIGRFGGDEFMILLKNTPEKRVIARIDELLTKSRIVYGEGENAVHLSLSVGAVLCESEIISDFVELMNMADKELYAAKENGRDQYQFMKIK